MSNTSEEESKYHVTGMSVMASTPRKRRNPPGNPDPEAEVIALSPKTLLATNRYICEVCHKGFQRDQNLQLHRRGHNLPWKLKQRTGNDVKKRVYVCPEATCAHHDRTRALGDLTGIKKHYSRKHGDKKWKCDKCNKRYAVQSDWKAHSKICGTKEYRCDCGTVFSRKDSFVTHRAFCDALTEENFRANHAHHQPNMVTNLYNPPQNIFSRAIPWLGSSTMEATQDIPPSDFKSLLHNPSMLPNSDTLFNYRNFGMSNMPMNSSFISNAPTLQQTSVSLPDAINRYANTNSFCMDASEVSSYEGISTRTSGDVSCFGEASFVQFPVGGSRVYSMQRRDGGEEIGDRRNGRMTKDFLGLGDSVSASVSSSGNANYLGDEFYPYQQMNHGTMPFEKHVWQ